MNTLEVVSNNAFLSTILATGVVALFGFALKWFRDYRDTKKIYKFLLKSSTSTGFTFRSTEAISAEMDIPESRVETLCSKDPRIKRNQLEKQSWRLAD